MVKQSFHPDDLQKAFIPFGPVMGLAAVLGPILAGVLLNADLFGTGWRMIFLINVPVGLVGLVLSIRYLPETERNTSSPAGRRRRGSAGRRLGAADLPAGAGPRARLAGLVLPDDGRLGRRVRRLRGQRAAQRAPGHRAVAVPQPRLRRRPGLPRHVLRRDERPHADHQPVHAGRARLLAAAHRLRHDAARRSVLRSARSPPGPPWARGSAARCCTAACSSSASAWWACGGPSATRRRRSAAGTWPRAVRGRARQRRDLRPALRHHPGRPGRPRGRQRLGAAQRRPAVLGRPRASR